jgi:hypothetical protein
MFKLTFVYLLLLAAFFSADAQRAEQPMQKNTFFLELGGNGLFYSLNYDRILLGRSTWKLSGRMGGLYFPGLGEANRHMIGLPLELSYLRGRNNHHLELGLGFTPMYDTYPIMGLDGQKDVVQDLALMGVARIGYRHQKREGGLFYKIGFTPLLGTVYDLSNRLSRPTELFAYPLVGLSLGYTLKK